MKHPIKKTKRFSGEDGESEVIDMRDNKANTIGNEVRARAMKAMEERKNKEVTPVKKFSKPITRAVPKAVPKANPENTPKSSVNNSLAYNPDSPNNVISNTKDKEIESDMAYKKGGKVAGRLATRGYGMCGGGMSKGKK
jgi:hypothetical protein